MKATTYLPRILFYTVLTLLPLKNGYSQGFYFNAGGGYNFNTTNISNVDLCEGFGALPSLYYYYYTFQSSVAFSFSGINQTYTETDANGQSTYTNIYQALNKGFGGGATAFVSAGYGFSKNISAEIGFAYLGKTSMQSTNTSVDNDYYNSSNPIITSETITSTLASSARYRIEPVAKLSLPISQFTPYLKAGFVIGLGGTITLTNNYTETQTNLTYYSPPQTANTGITASGGLSLGYTGSVGVEYTLKDFITIYCEVNTIIETWSPTSGDIKTYTESGVTPPYTLTNTQFTYSNNITNGGALTQQTYPASNVIPVNSQYPKQSFSYNSYGFAVGIKISILKGKASAPKTQDYYSPSVPKTN